MKLKWVCILSLGCPRNLWDSECLARILKNKGYKICSLNTPPHIVILNTCGFIKEAKEESLEYMYMLVDMKRKGQIKKLIVMGCLVKRYIKHLLKYFPEVDAFLDIYYITKNNIIPYFTYHRYYYYLKIAEGCNYRCSYCAIPLIRGPLYNRPFKDILKEVKSIPNFVKEIILVAQNTTSWRDGRKDLVYLIKNILDVKPVPWLRILYAHPLEIKIKLLKLIRKEKRICKYLDLPLQHVNSRILRLMKRNITKQEIKDLITTIRRFIPDIFLRTTFIVGFPQETEQDFLELIEFIKKYPFERLGCFIYSREEGTPAYRMKQIPYKTRERRFHTLMQTQRKISSNIQQKFVGQTLEVLIEEEYKDHFIGRTQYDAPSIDGVVFLKKSKKIKLGEIQKVKVTNSFEYDLEAEAL